MNKTFHYSTTGSSLKHNDFNQKVLEHTLSIPLLTSAIRKVTNKHEFAETKKELTLWERVSSNETCMRVREGCVWAFCGARSMVEGYYDLIKTF